MSARLFDGERHIKVAFFARCYKAEEFIDADHIAVDNGAAFVDNVFKLNVLLFEPRADMRRSFFRPGFFVVTEAEINVAFGLPAFGQKFFGGFED